MAPTLQNAILQLSIDLPDTLVGSIKQNSTILEKRKGEMASNVEAGLSRDLETDGLEVSRDKPAPTTNQ